ncbi:MAG: NAD-dependent epimerase/dehydratase family protein [Actinomycetota bacterium]
MRILALGGTRFVGRAFVEEALAAGHELTLFNRGTTAPDLFPDAETVRGDRERDLAALGGRTWDAVFDASCYVPRVARASARALAGAARHYTFISSLSAYADQVSPGQDETAPLATIDDPTAEAVTDDTYGALKVLSEREVQAVFGDRALVLRPGYICGPYDAIDRMPYWLRRVERGGEFLAPERPDFPVQLIDARDLARFALGMASRGEGGAFNVCAPQEPHRFGDLLEAAAAVVGQPDLRPVWASAGFLLEHGLDAWEALPWWVPPAEYGVVRFDAAKAFAAGLQARPVQDSFRDCWAWDRTRAGRPLRPGEGLEPAREARLLEAWRARTL